MTVHPLLNTIKYDFIVCKVLNERERLGGSFNIKQDVFSHGKMVQVFKTSFGFIPNIVDILILFLLVMAGSHYINR